MYVSIEKNKDKKPYNKYPLQLKIYFLSVINIELVQNEQRFYHVINLNPPGCSLMFTNTV
jgi:hypothetical protein